MEAKKGHVNGYNVQGTIIVRGINDGNRTENKIPSYMLVINDGHRTEL